MKIINKILKIIDKQVSRLEDKSKSANLTQEEVLQLEVLAKTAVTVLKESKVPRGRRPYKTAERVTDEDLVLYAKDK